MDEKIPSVKLKGRNGVQTCALTVPQSYALRFDVWLAGGENATRAYAAALGLANGKAGKGCKLRGGDILDYGGQVIDRLLAEGVSYRDLRAAGAIAYSLLVDGLEEMVGEVEEAVGFSAAPPDTSTE